MNKLFFEAEKTFIDGEFQENIIISVSDGFIREVMSKKDFEEANSIKPTKLKGFLLPGLVDCHSHIGLLEEMDPTGDDVNELSNPVNPALRVLDAINPEDASFREALESGITTVAIAPGSSNLIGGQIGAFSTYGTNIDEMVLDPYVAMKGALGENPKRDYGRLSRAPFTRMGQAALLRKAFYDAKSYMKEKEKDNSLFDFNLEPLVSVLKKEVPFRVHVHRKDDILTAIRIAKEFDIRLGLEHVTSGLKVLDELQAFEPMLAIGPIFMTRCKREMVDINPFLAKVFEEKSLEFSLITDSPELPSSSLLLMAILAKKNGLSDKGALQSITVNPSKILGLDHVVGSIKEGCRADFALFDQHPLDIYSNVKQVYVKGVRVV